MCVGEGGGGDGEGEGEGGGAAPAPNSHEAKMTPTDRGASAAKRPSVKSKPLGGHTGH